MIVKLSKISRISEKFLKISERILVRYNNIVRIIFIITKHIEYSQIF